MLLKDNIIKPSPPNDDGKKDGKRAKTKVGSRGQEPNKVTQSPIKSHIVSQSQTKPNKVTQSHTKSHRFLQSHTELNRVT